MITSELCAIAGVQSSFVVLFLNNVGSRATFPIVLIPPIDLPKSCIPRGPQLSQASLLCPDLNRGGSCILHSSALSASPCILHFEFFRVSVLSTCALFDFSIVLIPPIDPPKSCILRGPQLSPATLRSCILPLRICKENQITICSEIA
jgi:hypothetical protein